LSREAIFWSRFDGRAASVIVDLCSGRDTTTDYEPAYEPARANSFWPAGNGLIPACGMTADRETISP
jgi:hypothetical protein